MGTVHAVVLAAGQSQRFAGTKLLTQWHGRPLLWHALQALVPAREKGLLAGGCVVVPPDQPAFTALASEAGLLPLPNPKPASGLSSSLQIAFGWLRSQVGGSPAAAVICLGDQPRVAAHVVIRLAEAWRQGKGVVVRPRYADAPRDPGHPMLLDRSLWSLVDELEGDTGLGPLLTARGIPICTIEVAGRNPDVDVPNDVTTLEDTEP